MVFVPSLSGIGPRGRIPSAKGRRHFSSLVAVCSAKGDFSMKRRTKGDQFSEKGLLGNLGLLKETQERSLEQGVQPNIFEGGLAGMAWRFVYIPIYE